MPSIFAIEFTLPDSSGEEASPFLSEYAPQGWEEVNGAVSTVYRVHFPERDSAGEFGRSVMARWPGISVIVREKEKEDWAMSWKDFFVPVSCGERFEILPPWLSDQADPNLTPIVIEPKVAFGTGHHPTTALCLECIAALHNTDGVEGMRFLDLGTGSGILAIGLALLGLNGLGLDIDPDAIPCAVENGQVNGVSKNVSFAVGTMDCLQPGELFHVIVANILSGPLIELAPSILPHLEPGGLLILSGILADQAERVAQAYVHLGLAEPEILIRGEWSALRFSEVGL
ncbi:MAG: 50S ribosomal protein L11 methyltransferase [Proteobacteria bacterium]|nr:50S ribosomal protein L11 methyltransferase [Pseudomonadota bacterium]MBU1612495.1 50S ribosomal protein L11 methyltransferase [Pseudomonadota bacterium]